MLSSFVAIVVMFILGIIFFFVALGNLLAPEVFKCDKLKNICYREIPHFWSARIQTVKLCAVSDIVSAAAERSAMNENNYCTVLKLKKGNSIAIFATASSWQRPHQKQAKIINDFLQQDKQQLSIKDFALFKSILCAVCAILLFCGAAEFGLRLFSF